MAGPGSIRPAPTEEEAVAIVAALDAAWPKAVVVAEDVPAERWRWSGRWWSRPVPLRRHRPW